MIEVTVTGKGEDCSFRDKQLLFGEMAKITLSNDDPILKAIVQEALAKFKGNLESIVVKITYQWQENGQ